jgi:hypothetical protein
MKCQNQFWLLGKSNWCTLQLFLKITFFFFRNSWNLQILHFFLFQKEKRLNIQEYSTCLNEKIQN